MNIEIFKGYRQFVSEQGVLFYYDGYLSQAIITAMGEALRGKLEAEDSASKATRKVFSTFVEMMQNIIHYADPAKELDVAAYGNVAVGRHKDHYYIVSGNSVATSHVERLQAKLEAIRAMPLDEIKAEYKRKLRTGSEAQDENSKGAGLGFLTVARDASEPIEFLFEPIAGTGNVLSFFYLKATVEIRTEHSCTTCTFPPNATSLKSTSGFRHIICCCAANPSRKTRWLSTARWSPR